MIFFDAQGNQIQPAQWLSIYEHSYFLDQPKQNGQPRNQTSPFVEDQVCALLTQSGPLSGGDLNRAMAWKLGEIDHRGSEISKQIKYQHNWQTAVRDRYQRDFSSGISFLASRMPTILQEVNRGNPEYLFNLHPTLANFGPTYILTVLFFVTRGKFPIYDHFAHVAAQAIHSGLAPGSALKCKAVQEWNQYQQYRNLLLPISKACAQPTGPSSMFVSRPTDRALWVYGHLFKDVAKPCDPRKPARAYPQTTPTQPAVFKGVLVGRICDLSNMTNDGWRRREINVRQGPDGHPAVREIFHLIDTSGTRYSSLPFIKGARLPGHTCLGQPGALRPWFTRHYSADRVESENVYFKPTGQPSEYCIYTESEWKALANVDRQ
jgi:hypothetical protein